jgi:MFS family permease
MSNVAVTTLTVTAAVVAGMVMALFGNLKLVVARRPEHADRQVGRLLSALNLALIPFMLAAGLFVDAWGVRPTLIAGSMLLALSFLALSARPAYEQTLFTVAAAAVGACGLHVATLVQLPRGLFGVSEVAASLQLGLVFVALGALLAPPLLDMLLATAGFRRTMALLALVFLLPAFLAGLPAAEDFAHPRVARLAEVLDPRVLMAGLVFFVYAPLEAFVSVWTATYLGNLGQAERQSRWLACFWAAMLASRFGFAFILQGSSLGDEYTGWFLVLPAVLSAVVLGNMSGATRHQSALSGLILLGFFLGPVFPMLLAKLFMALVGVDAAGNKVDGPDGTAYALLHAFGSVGSLLLAPLVRLSAGQRSIQAALRIPLLIALVLAASTLMFALVARQ